MVRFRMVLGYARVSTDEQTNEAQLRELQLAGCSRIYEEKLSRRTRERPELKRCVDRLDRGDTLMVWRLDRLGNSLRDLLEIFEGLETQGVIFVSLKERFDTGTAAGRLIFNFLASLTQFQRELIRERTMSGLAAGRARGRVGRRKSLSDQQSGAIRTLWDSRHHTKLEIAAQFGVSRSTIDRVIRPERVTKEVNGRKIRAVRASDQCIQVSF